MCKFINIFKPCESEDPNTRRFSTRTEQLLTVQAQKASSRREVKSKDKSSSLWHKLRIYKRLWRPVLHATRWNLILQICSKTLLSVPLSLFLISVQILRRIEFKFVCVLVVNTILFSVFFSFFSLKLLNAIKLLNGENMVETFYCHEIFWTEKLVSLVKKKKGDTVEVWPLKDSLCL